MSDSIIKKTRIPINVIAVLGLGVLVAAAIGSVLYLGLSAARKNTIELLTEKVETSIDVISSQIDRHLEPVQHQAEWIADAIRQGRISIDDGSQLKIFLEGALSATPQVSAVGFVRPDGSMTAYIRKEKQARNMSWPHGEGYEILLEKTKSLTEPTWQSPIWSEDLKQMIVILQTPVRKDDRLMGVLNLTVPIAGLSKFLANKAVADLVPFIIYDKTRLIAHPFLIDWRPENFLSSDLPDFNNLGDDVLSHIWDKPTEKINMLHTFRAEHVGKTTAKLISIGDVQYLFIYQEMNKYGEKPWIVGQYLDSRAVDKQVNRLGTTLIVGIIFFVVTLTLALIGGHWVSGPVRAIAIAAGKVRKGSLDDVPTLDPSRILELDQAARSFNEMVDGLRESQTIRQALGRYVPEKVAESLLRDGGKIDTVETEATVLFSDIENFTEMTENLGPEGIVSLLNEYFSEMVDILERHGGVVTQFQGDAILATFNVPITDPDHAQNALQAAVEMQQASSRQTFGGRQVGTRIGVNTGTLVAGAVGARGRLNYTVHGDAVNLAARVETLNKDYKTRILTTESTASKTQGFPLKRIGEIPIRGQSVSIILYELEVNESP